MRVANSEGLRCRACDRRGARDLDVTCRVGNASRVWRLQLCRDCWRAWEATLDIGSASWTSGLFDQPRHEKLFLW